MPNGRKLHGRPLWSWLLLQIAVIVAFIASLACSAIAKHDSKRVMVLHSFGRDFKPWSEYARAIRAELERQSPWPVDIIDHSLVTARSSDEDSERPFVDYLRALFARRLPDLIISIGAPAAAFVQRNRSQLFADTPMVFTAVEQRRVQFSRLTANDAVVAVQINYLASFENILRVLPDTRNITVVVGTSPIEKFWKDAIAREVEPVIGRVTLSWADHLSFEELLQNAAKLPPQTALFWELMIVDAAGVVHEGNAALTRLHAVTSAPIFSYDESFFGRGTVGGPFLRVIDTSRETAAVAVRILGGEKPSDIRVPPVQYARPQFDFREMQRWGIPESRLPPGSEIHFREPSVWEKYRLHMLGVFAALLIQGALISWLIYEHWRRQKAEADSLQRMNELARLNRIATAGELSASIAHEIRQPLASIASGGSAALNWLQHKVPNVEEARIVLEAIVKASHRADEVIKGVQGMFRNQPAVRVAVDLNELVQQVLLLVEHPIRSNRIVLQTTFDNSASPLVMADPVQLQQVILNLIMNAIEAMSSAPHRARELHIETRFDQAGNVLLLVQDSGPGFDDKVCENLFKPFVTTKRDGMGMGLSICKSIVEQHQGTLTAASIKSRGAMFQIVLPRASMN
ncbi:MAG: GHKL domain-containing protein [Xanthobacteraceae bacterium]|nr:GHKL domain-containing protein [Xanthobacteraceae bacterium]